MKRDFLLLTIAMMPAVSGLAQNTTQDSALSINLQRHLEDVVVSAVRPSANAPMTYSEMDRQTIDNQNFGQDIPYLVSLTPSAVYTSDAGAGVGYTGIRIRGTDANRINITLNGIPLNDAESHSVFWVNMPDLASSLQNIQIVRGVGASTNGAAAFGATINMQTETLNPAAYAEYSGSAGAFSTFKNSVRTGSGLIHDKFAVDVRLSDIRTDGYIDRASAHLQSYYLSGTYYGENNMLKFITFTGKEKTYQAWNGVPADKLTSHRTYNPCGFMYEKDGIDYFYDNQTDNYTQSNIQLIYTHRLNASWNFHTALHLTLGEGFYEEYKLDAKMKRYRGIDTVVSDLVRQKWLDNVFYGGTFSLNYVKNKLQATIGGAASRYDGDHYGKVVWVKNYSVLPYEFYRNDATKIDANLFAKADYQLLEGLHAYADAQFRYIDYRIGGGENDRDDHQNPLAVHKKYPFYNPKAGFFYKINARSNAFISAAIAHREPNRDNFTDAGTAEHPSAETLYDYELGYRYSGERLRAGITGYIMDYRQQLVLTGKISEIGEMLTTNIPRSARMGIELQAGINITSWLRWDGNAAFSANKIYDYVEYVDAYDAEWNYLPQQETAMSTTDIAFSPNVVANSLFVFEYRGFTANLRSAYVGRQYIDNTSSADRSLAAYFVNNLQVGYGFTLNRVKINIDLLCNNVFNTLYESNAWIVETYFLGTERKNNINYFPQAGRHFMGRVVVKF